MTDPDRNQLLQVLNEAGYGPDTLDEFDQEEAIYWFASHNHSGQWSNLYSVLSTSKFQPGLLHDGPEEGSLAWDAYRALVGAFGMGDDT